MRYDEVVPALRRLLEREEWVTALPKGKKLVINRDIKGRISFILPKGIKKSLRTDIESFVRNRAGELAPWVHPEGARLFLEEELPAMPAGPEYPLFEKDDLPPVYVVERLLMGNEWATVRGVPCTKRTRCPERLVFFSVKGGVGRSTALAATAWYLAKKGKRVLVVDMDFQAPGVSANLLPEEQMPELGLVDWLMEAVVENEGAIRAEEVSRESPLAENLSGAIRVVPAYGRSSTDYVAKMGRIFLPVTGEGNAVIQSWTYRLEEKILKRLEEEFHPEVILFDSRAGIDDTAAAVVTNLGAKVLLFALDSVQTWKDYQVLFGCWKQWGKAKDIRENLQIVAGMVPPEKKKQKKEPSYLDRFTQQSYVLFLELYDEVPPDEMDEDWFSFALEDENAPHRPWPIYWNEGLLALQEFHTMGKDETTIELAYQPFFTGLSNWLEIEE